MIVFVGGFSNSDVLDLPKVGQEHSDIMKKRVLLSIISIKDPILFLLASATDAS